MDQFRHCFASIVALAASVTLAGCSMGTHSDGVPLDELDLTGEPPVAVSLLGPDHVIISDGTPFRIAAEGDDSEQLRFSLRDGTLGISRDTSSWSTVINPATVRITMPAPQSLTVTGSGRMTSTAMASDARTTIAGSGVLETPQLDVDSLAVSIVGSGDHIGGGKASSLNVSIAGSGNARLDQLKAGKSQVNIVGSGDIAFASDGEVNGDILGSGNVTVTGAAHCAVKSAGSGSATCKAPENAAH